LAGILEIGSTWYVAIILSVLLVTAFGTISGILVGYGKVPAFIVTLGMMSILRGFAYIYQVGSPKPIYDDTVISIGEKSFLVVICL
jgi:ribose/xylose/arabinose/galactoside ABC-type transport system permease subunit